MAEAEAAEAAEAEAEAAAPPPSGTVVLRAGAPEAAGACKTAYLVHFALTWRGFHLPELRAASEAAAVLLYVEPSEEETFGRNLSSSLLPVWMEDEASVRRLASRAVLARSFVDVWGGGATWEELERELLRYDRGRAAPFLAEGSTFCVRVHTLGGPRMGEEEKNNLIMRLAPLLPWKGKVRLKKPEHTFVILVEHPLEHTPTGQPTGVATGAPRYYFGRQVAEGQRDLVGTYDLKKRNYIGTTSLDAELSLLMANLARVRRHGLVYDPYAGTFSTLVAAAAFGARVLGCDLHGPAIRGELRTRSGPSKARQPARQGIPETFDAYGLAPPVGRLHGDSGEHLSFFRGGAAAGLFDAIITDPPCVGEVGQVGEVGDVGSSPVGEADFWRRALP